VLLTGIVTDEGGTAAGLLEDKVTTAPPAGAGAGITTTLFVVGFPPRMVFGLTCRWIRLAVLTVMTAEAVPLPVAVIVDVAM
jgi:hypothetical protein